MKLNNQTRLNTYKKNSKGNFMKDYGGWLFAVPAVLVFFFFTWRPIVIAMSYSFFDLKGFEPAEFVGLENFKTVLSDTNLVRTLGNTGKYIFWAILLEAPLSFIFAVLINEIVHQKQMFKILLYLPCLMPAVVTAALWKVIYADTSGGLINMLRFYLFGVEPMQLLSNKTLVIPLIMIMNSWNCYGGNMIMYLASLQNIDVNLYEASRLDGATLWQRVRYIMMPKMWGIILLVLIRQIIAVSQITQQPLLMTGGGPNGASMSIGLQNYVYAFQYNQYENSIALGVITFVILVAVTLIYFFMDKKINEME